MLGIVITGITERRFIGMKYKVAGYRKMLGLTQAEMAEKINVSETTYRNKEKGRIPFKDYEMEIIHQLLKPVNRDISISDIFFDY